MWQIVVAVSSLLAIGQQSLMTTLLDGAGTQIIRTNQSKVDPDRAANALKIEFLPAEWPNVAFAPHKPWDWSGHGALALDVTNPGRQSVEFGVRVDDDPAANGLAHCRTGTGSIAAGKTVRFVLPIGLDPMEVGMRGLPPAWPDLTSLNGSGKIDSSHVVAFQVFMHKLSAPRILILTNVRLLDKRQSLDGIADVWGQYANAEWPGKLHSDSDLRTRWQAEQAELRRQPTLAGFDRFGGWAEGPVRKATGFFRTERIDGKWWLVTPEGKLFFSIGLDCLNDSGETFITGRERMFAGLPEKAGPLGRFYGHATNVHSGPVKSGDTFNFLAANLHRKFGDDYRKRWFDHSFSRMRSWGFNTIGNWSDPALYSNGRIPYVVTVHVGGNHARVASGQDYWGTMHDPFDPQFALDIRSSLRAVKTPGKDDPWCLGWFVDNEISWGGGADDKGRLGLALGTLAMDSSASPAKRALVKQLRDSYRDIEGLNAAWATSFAGWTAIERPCRLDGAMNDALRTDLRNFVLTFARTYFRTIAEELRQVAPNHLYLGCRFAWHTPEAARASAEYCDVVSFNIYDKQLDLARASFYASLNKPCIIGEFHFGALDRGMFHCGLVPTANQQERAEAYKRYVQSVIDSPSFVGCHWFQYVDEPLTGRFFDGENYNIGFVNVTDTPYPELVAAARQVHVSAYVRRFGATSTAR